MVPPTYKNANIIYVYLVLYTSITLNYTRSLYPLALFILSEIFRDIFPFTFLPLPLYTVYCKPLTVTPLAAP